MGKFQGVIRRGLGNHTRGSPRRGKAWETSFLTGFSPQRLHHVMESTGTDEAPSVSRKTYWNAKKEIGSREEGGGVLE